MNIPLLLRMREAGGAFVLLDELGPNPTAIQADLDELEAYGFHLERHPYLGVAYKGHATRLCPDQIEWELATRHIGRRIAVWDRVPSTNDLAARAARSTANDGLVILAEWQSAGRGRRGRTWSAPSSSSILMSVLVFPPERLSDPAWLTALGAVATAEVVEELAGRQARVKWPNDVRVDGKKIAGVLVERGQGAVIGIGLNVNLRAEQMSDELRETATSLQVLRREALDRSEVAKALIRRLDEHYGCGWERGGLPLNDAWRSRLESIGAVVEIESSDGPVVGRLLDADLTRGLTLAIEPRGTRQFPCADVVAVRSTD